MLSEVAVSLTGVDDVVGKFASITDDVKYRGGRSSLRKASELIRAAAEENAAAIDDPLTPNSIAANVATRWNGRLWKSKGDLGFRIGLLGGARQYFNTRENRRKRRAGSTYTTDGGKGNPGGDTHYWRHIEFGTQHIPANPFMRRALAENIQAATDKFVSEYKRAIDRAIKRARKLVGR
jgi:HK97 gp10 family phage protein